MKENRFEEESSVSQEERLAPMIEIDEETVGILGAEEVTAVKTLGTEEKIKWTLTEKSAASGYKYQRQSLVNQFFYKGVFICLAVNFAVNLLTIRS